MLIPYGTDAPIYYLPIATIVIIAVNIAVFAAQLAFGELFDPYVLMYSEINPLQWLTSMLMHAGLGHILGNMLFLAIFGIIVEGKVGWYKFLAIYLFSGVTAGGMIQCMMYFLGGYGSALGASCAIFGIMGIALVWAPENEIYFKLILIILIRIYIFSFEVSVLLTAFGFVAWNFLIAAFTGFEMSSATAHLVGLVPGLLVGFVFVMLRWVDCEGYDIISNLTGKRGKKPDPTVAELETERQKRLEARIEAEQKVNYGLKMVNQYANQGKFEMAVKRLNMLKKENQSIVVPELAANKLIKHYLATDNEKSNAIPIMEECIANYPSRRLPMTLSLARLYVVIEQRPRKGLNLLKTVPQQDLSSTQKDFFRKLVTQAKKMIADGILEIDDV